MRVKSVIFLLGLAALLSGFAASSAVAEQNVPGSVLVYPYVDSSASSPTIISISNTYLRIWKGPVKHFLPPGDETCEEGVPPKRYGETSVHFIFFDSQDCLETNFDVFLSREDHVTFLANDKIPDGRTGWMVAFAVDPEFPDGEIVPWNHDFLVGQAHVVDAQFDLSWTYNAYAFLSSKYANSLKELPGIDPPPVPIGPPGPYCGRYYLDHEVGDNDGALNFDNIEYEPWPDKLYLPRFYEEYNDGEDFDSLLSLISPLSTLEQFRTKKVTFSVLFWNNDENESGFPFSKTENFTCQFIGSLRSISNQFMMLDGTDAEEPTGWATFDGYLLQNTPESIIDPPLLGVFAQINKILGGDPAKYTGGNNLFFYGFNEVPARIQYRFD